MEYLFIYLLQMCNTIEAISTMTCIVTILLFFALLVIIFFAVGPEHLFDEENKYYKSERKAFRAIAKTSTIFAIITAVLAFIPTKQTLLLMGGTYLGKKAVNEVVQSDKMEKINTIIDLQLDKYIKDLQGATK